MLKNDHSFVHSAKVALFALLIAEQKDCNIDDMIALFAAALFHDVGRTNNCNDSTHGRKSVVKASSYGYVLPDKVQKIIVSHSQSDKKKNTHDELLKIFKDADALDRGRTGDLDESYLRVDESKTLIEFAKDLNRLINDNRKR